MYYLAQGNIQLVYYLNPSQKSELTDSLNVVINLSQKSETADSSDVASIPDELELEIKPDDLLEIKPDDDLPEKEDDAKSTVESTTEVNKC